MIQSTVICMLFAITDIIVYKWTLEWIERMGSRSINNLLVITKNARWIMLHSIIQNISKKEKKRRDSFRESIEPITISKAPFQSPDVLVPPLSIKYSTYRVHFRYFPQTWKVDGPRGEKNN